MMILPLIFFDHIFELPVVILSAAQVKDEIRVFIILIQESSDLRFIGGLGISETYVINVISVGLFKARGWKAHPCDTLRHESDIEIVILILQAVPFAAHNFPEKVHLLVVFEVAVNSFQAVYLLRWKSEHYKQFSYLSLMSALLFSFNIL